MDLHYLTDSTNSLKTVKPVFYSIVTPAGEINLLDRERVVGKLNYN